MKTAPTETDREAARLFEPAPGVRAWRDGQWYRITWARGGTADGTKEAEEDCDLRIAYCMAASAIEAIDVDDGPTQGAMMVQVEAAAGAPVELWHCPDDPPDKAHVVFVRDPSFESFCASARGAALVAAMKALKGAK